MHKKHEGIEQVFSFELTPVQTSLFTMDRMMKRPQKHEFGRMLKETTADHQLCPRELRRRI